ncbi:MAG: high-affinity branched-chain amino acid ABC transporter ATP-binding protein LivG [Stappia sp.]|uniref:ABC transporter ATP-binding protein n=1 Tax=Stappia sp. TaxID=1870903 RepID=UPI000C685C39|nr:ABC transporter ATP-binding protein [Stappia sp.]MAB01084.1 high-affinity branched-chain amino acid ABC transporter ATP-binding protein LivG [Stappia sp.]MBM22241.1 high-affinity branched-chain amino acid ABC transporter ATP-binding protein LivG [Stappia sp.]
MTASPAPLSRSVQAAPARLTVEDIGISFGGVKAVDGVSFTARTGEVLSIIGPNGAGKTTLFNLVSGVYQPKAGKVTLGDEAVTGLSPDRLATRGLSRTFQNLQVFFRMTARENVMVGRHLKERRGLLSHLLALPSTGRQNRESAEVADRLLARVGLSDYADTPAASMPYGALKRLEIARALAAEPEVLLLDEPAAGCNAVETEEIEKLVRAIADEGVAMVLVEHDMKLVMRISDKILVLDQGRMLAEGTGEQIRTNPKVIEAYLGTHGTREANLALD